MKKIVQKVKDKVAYEQESRRMGDEALKDILKDHPEMLRRKGGKR